MAAATELGIFIKSASKIAISSLPMLQDMATLPKLASIYILLPLVIAALTIALTLYLKNIYKKYIPLSLDNNSKNIISQNLFLIYEIIICVFLLFICDVILIVDEFIIPFIISLIFISLINHYFDHINFNEVFSNNNFIKAINILYNNINYNHINGWSLFFKYIFKISVYSIIIIILLLFIAINADIDQISYISLAILIIGLISIISIIVCYGKSNFKIFRFLISYIICNIILRIYFLLIEWISGPTVY